MYDGNGSRIKKISAAETTIFVYDASNKLVAEYLVTTSTPQAPQTSYLTNDTLGSPRVITNSAGVVTSRRDFMPYGEEINGLGGRTTALGYTVDSIRRKFTSYQRDTESGLDFAQARYYDKNLGRFTSPDEFSGGPAELFNFADDAADNPTFYADLTEPQSLNKYLYTYNNPLNLVDPDGHRPIDKSSRNIEDVLDSYSSLWERKWGEGKFENELRLSGCPRCPARPNRPWRPSRRSDRYYRNPTRRNRGGMPANTPFGPGLNEQYTQRQIERDLQNVTLVPLLGPQRNYPSYPNQFAKHHIFPQSGEFARFWKRAGIDINNFTIRIPRGQHLELHSGIGMGRGGNWNNQWREFFRQNPDANRQQIFQQGQQMIMNLQVTGPVRHFRPQQNSMGAPEQEE